VSIRGKAIAFAGESGLGKSTLAAALADRGASVLSDDILVFDPSEDPVQAIPGYPRLRLWPDSAAHMFGDPDALPTMSPKWDKRYLALNGKYHFETRPYPLEALYICSPNEKQRYPESKPLSDTAGLMTLLAQTYPSPILYPPDRTQQAETFAALKKLIATVPVYQLHYDRSFEHLFDLCQFLAESLIPV